MAWQYSSPLGSALLAANGGQSETLGLGSTSIYQPYFSSYDPLFTTRYQPRTNFFDRSLFDDLELELEVDDTILSSTRYRPSVYTNKTSTYVPSYFNSLKTSLNQTNNNYDSLGIDNASNNFVHFQNDDSLKQSKQEPNRQQQPIISHQQQPVTYTDNLKKQTKATNLKPKKNNAVNPANNNANNKQGKKFTNGSYPNFGAKNPVQPVQTQPSQQPNYTPSYQRLFQPLPFQQTPTIYNNINSVESSANLDGSINHNNQQLRFLQYQQRLLQQQQQEVNKNENLSELELLKLRQQQEKQQLLQAIAANATKERNQNQYQPFFQDLNQKQYSETSIPSTNADPLNSNTSTPPPLNHRAQKINFDKPSKPNNPSNFQVKKTQGFYYKLNEKQNEDQADPSSYLNTMRDARIREQRLTKDKYTSQDYKQYQKNYGFGKEFLPFETETKRDKQEKARKREEYSKMIKERNTVLMDGNTHNISKYEKYNPTIYSLNDPVTKRNQVALNKVKN